MAAGKSKGLGSCKPPPSKKSKKERNQRKVNDNASSDEILEQIWKEFPEDLFEAVIARLPVSSVFRFRTVCRKWNAMLHSQTFSEQCSQVRQRYPWFFNITHDNFSYGVMYDPSSKKWHHPTISFLPMKIIALPVASAGGLVCFVDIGHRNFFVCNPLTRSFKELPARSVRVWSQVAVGMVLDESLPKAGYKIMWLGCDGEYGVYESVKNAWFRPGNMPPNIRLPLSLNFKSQAVSIGSRVYFMRADPEGIISYDMYTGTWKQFIIPSPPLVADHALAVCGEKIMLVGLLSKNAATCVCIWELQRMTLLWKEVDRMPNIWSVEFYGRQIRMTCLGNKGLLMLLLRSRQMNRVIMYDPSKREWAKVPTCTVPHSRKRHWIACGTAFHPCATAVA
ncbi:hypothetical protein MLD38_002402 [Melastoma candidum]|uniref:Uncharacterized protein n=1 Tax=Melastoma candidum TaxID=119954 RepID=A0ACB9S7S3_9MYRT|nr:hypothetical protein MLD38_002402 [Melastoma candidum]